MARPRPCFSNNNRDTLYIVVTHQQYFKPALVTAELSDFNLYSLRHTMATRLLANGENAKVTNERLGHSTIVLTLDTYTRVLPDMQPEAVERI